MYAIACRSPRILHVNKVMQGEENEKYWIEAQTCQARRLSLRGKAEHKQREAAEMSSWSIVSGSEQRLIITVCYNIHYSGSAVSL